MRIVISGPIQHKVEDRKNDKGEAYRVLIVNELVILPADEEGTAHGIMVQGVEIHLSTKEGVAQEIGRLLQAPSVHVPGPGDELPPISPSPQ